MLPVKWNFERGATWADEIKRRPTYSWSYPTHFIDGTVHPSNCSFIPPPDYLTTHNIITAIANHTTHLFLSSNFTNYDGVTAGYNTDLLFLIHHIGDLAQPLHAFGKARGGNDVLVLEEYGTFDVRGERRGFCAARELRKGSESPGSGLGQMNKHTGRIPKDRGNRADGRWKNGRRQERRGRFFA
ncbi:hypothetical protein HK097_008791 [Rhizophlyctis rosea]|uniref:Uncharacterized protein n=1 Tax=Rhizophlyctis rosea TaxID=64517 RepID=A0AAD5SBZ3_9FUNG|nr:hypothetical protein HK097_008791 [Rhizophlyctis rosea]